MTCTKLKDLFVIIIKFSIYFGIFKIKIPVGINGFCGAKPLNSKQMNL